MCKNCETNPVYEFTNRRKLCKNCFVYWFEKKFLYTIRKFKMFSLKDKASFEDNKGLQSKVLEECLKILERGKRITLLKPNLKKGYDKFALNSTLDEETNEFINTLIKNKKANKELLPVNKKFVRPLYFFLDKEVGLYAKIKKIKHNKVKKEHGEWEKFIDALEKSHPEIKQATMQSCLKLYHKEK